MSEDFSKYNGEGTELRQAQLRLVEMMIEFDRICKKHNIPYFISGGTCLGAIRHGGFIPWDDDVDIDVLFKDYKKLSKVLVEELPSNYFLQTPKTEKGYYQTFNRIVDINSKIYYRESSKSRSLLKYDGLFLDIFPLQRPLSFKLKTFFDKIFITVFRLKRGIGGNLFYKSLSIVIYPFLKFLINVLNYFSSARFLPLSENSILSHIYGTNITPKINFSNIFPLKPITFEGYYFSGPSNPQKYLEDLYGNYMQMPPIDNRKAHSVKIEVYDVK